MPTKLKSTVLHYLGGAAASAWNAGLTAVVGSLGLLAASAVDPLASALKWRGMLDLFCGAAFVHALIWLTRHPLPENLPDDPTTPSKTV